MEVVNKKIEAARLVSEGNLSNPAVADKVGVSTSTIYNWLKQEEFKEMIEEFIEEGEYKLLPLYRKEEMVKVDREDYDRYKDEKIYITNGGYAVIRRKDEDTGKWDLVPIHKDVTDTHRGRMMVSHINGDRLDCRKENLLIKVNPNYR